MTREAGSAFRPVEDKDVHAGELVVHPGAQQFGVHAALPELVREHFGGVPMPVHPLSGTQASYRAVALSRTRIPAANPIDSELGHRNGQVVATTAHGRICAVH